MPVPDLQGSSRVVAAPCPYHSKKPGVAYPGCTCDEAAPDRVVEAVRADLLRRSIHGFNKYGAGLDTNPAPLVGQLQHAYEEALDLCNYLKWSIMRLEGSAELVPDETRGTGLGGV
jgi:hypothetical protein